MILNIMCVGIGGMGVMTMGNVLKEWGMKSSEIVNVVCSQSKGVSQREGSVYSLVRYIIDSPNKLPCEFISPHPPLHSVEIMIALEPLELLRNAHYLHPNAKIILNTQENIPKSNIISDTNKYPNINEKIDMLKDKLPDITIISNNYSELALEKFNNSIFVNSLMLKELSNIDNNIFNNFNGKL